MASKQKGKQAPKVVPHKDHYARMSYLYQASNYLASNPKYNVLSRSLARNVLMVSKKTVLKITPAMKRGICKGCYNMMTPGSSMEVYIENESKDQNEKCDVLVHRCLPCGKLKRFPIGKNRKYQLFSEREDIRTDAE